MKNSLYQPRKREEDNEWMITYADIITLLLAFFVILRAGGDAAPEGALNAGHGLSCLAVVNRLPPIRWKILSSFLRLREI